MRGCLDREERLVTALLLLLLLLLRKRVVSSRLLTDELARLLAVSVTISVNAYERTAEETYLSAPKFPNVSIPSSRLAKRLASLECSSSVRVLTFGIVFCLGGAEWDIGGGDWDDWGCCCEYVPCRLNETGLAV